MEHATAWTARIYLEEHDLETRARASLDTGDNVLEGHGVAQRSPRDVAVPEIGNELAVARALTDLAHKLFDAAVADVEAMTSEKPTITA